MTRSGGLVAALLLAAACGDGDPIFAPGDSRANATIVVTVAANGVTAVAYEGDAAMEVELDLDAGDMELWVLHYERTLAELRLTAGIIPPAGPDESSRPLPEFLIGRRAVVADNDSIGFEEVSALSGRAADFRMRAFDALGCAMVGGCIVSDVCEMPCPPTSEVAAPLAVTPPVEAAPPVLTPCPAGWAQTEIDGVAVCDLPARTETPCPDGSAQWVDSPTCAAIVACPAGDWPDPVPANARWFVRPGDAGDGTMNTPFGSIDDALAVASPGDVVVLARGRHDAGTHDVGASFAGACPAETVVAGDLDIVAETTFQGVTVVGDVTVEPTGTLVLREVMVNGDVRDEGLLTLASVRVEGHLNVDTGTATVNRAVFQRTDDYGVRVDEGSATLEDVAISDVALDGGDDQRGDGIRVIGARLTARRLLVDRASYTGFTLTRGIVDLEDLVVRGTRPRADDASGQGIDVRRTSTVTVSRATFLENRTFCVYVRHEANLTLTDVVVANTQSRLSNGGDGQGLYARDDAIVRGERVWITGSHGTGVVVRGGQTSLTDVTVRATMGTENSGRFGEGIFAGDDASVRLERAVVDDNNEAGVVVSDDASLEAKDLIVRNTRTSINGDRGYGVVVSGSGVRATVERALVEDNRRHGVRAVDGADLSVTDLTVLRTTRDDIGDERASGVFVRRASVTIQRARIEANEDRGVRTRDDGVVTIGDAVVRENGDYGLLASDDGRITGGRLVVELNGQANAAAGGRGDLQLDHVRLARCRTVRSGFAAGLIVDPDGQAEVQTFVIEDNEGAGVIHRLQGTVSLADGVIRGHPVGLLSSDGVEDSLEIALDHVDFVDNDLPISAP